MPGRKTESIDLTLMKGNKPGLTKSEIAERRAKEETARAPCDKITPPSYLTKKQKDEFTFLAEELMRVNLFSNLDIDTLAQYIDTKAQYIDTVKSIRKFKPLKQRVNENTGEVFTTTCRDYASLQRTKDLLIRQARSIAAELGLTLNSRLKLIIPTTDDKPKTKEDSKFSRWVK